MSERPEVVMPPITPDRLCPKWRGRHDLPAAPSEKNAVARCARCGRWMRSHWWDDNVAWGGWEWRRIHVWNRTARRLALFRALDEGPHAQRGGHS